MDSASKSSNTPTPDVIKQELEKILSSTAFSQSKRLSRFLRYTVEQAIEGRAEKFKEFLLGVEVFDKAPSFDPRIDSIVRVEACRLRSRLNAYYETEGQLDSVLVEFHKGSYAPAFSLRAAPAPVVTESHVEAPEARIWQTVAVLPFEDMSIENGQDHLADGLTEELIYSLTKLPGLRVVAQTSVFQYKGRAKDIRQIGRDLQADAVVEGSLRKAGPNLRIIALLVDVLTGYIVWSGNYERLLEDVFAVQAEVSQVIAGALRAQLREPGRMPDS